MWRSRKLWRNIGFGVFLLFTVWMAGGYVAARYGTAPRHAKVEPRPQILDHAVQSVNINTEDGLRLSAWYIPADTERAVIVMPGIRCSRRSATSNAEMYLSWGYTVLMPDLRGTGESDGELVSIGYYERKDLIACFKYLKDLGYRHIGAHGTSLGAATICFAAPELPELSFAVLESSYDTINHALDNRLDMYNVPHFLAWPVKMFATLRLGAGPRQIRPIDYIARFTAPTLIIGGDSERVLRLAETEALYQHCSSPLKKIHIFKGGRHETFVRRYKEECRATVRSFLDEADSTSKANLTLSRQP